MARIKKSTRKFGANHLKDTLRNRAAHAGAKQRYKLQEKRKQKKRASSPAGSGSEKETKEGKKPDGGMNEIENMTVEQFFQSGFEVPELEEKTKKKKKKEKKGEKEIEKKKEKRKREEIGKEEEEGEETGESSGGELEAHKTDLSALKEKDPEFYKFLQENDSELLDFSVAERDDLSSVANASDGAGEDEEPKKKKRKKSKSKKSKPEEEKEEEEGGVGDAGDDSRFDVEVTLKDVRKWTKALVEEKSLRCLKKVVLAFRAAVHVNDADEKSRYKYSITNPDVYHELLILALKHAPGVFNHHLPVQESSLGKVRVPTDTKKFRVLSPLLKSHSSSLLHLLPTLTDSSTQKLILNSTIPLVPYFLPLRKFLRSFVKAVADVWSSSSAEESARITAFLVIRKIIVVGDEGLKQMSFKALYAGLIRSSRQTSRHTMDGINLMKNSAGEILGLDGMHKVGYSVAFGYIRQLAIHLRDSINNNSKESYKTVYNWQYVHSLDFWSRALSTHCDEFKEAKEGKTSPLKPLIYPLTQVTLGAIKLIPTAQYFPLRFYLIRSLLRLSRATGVFIPLAPLLFEVLSSASFKKKPKASTLRPLDFALHIRAPQSYLLTQTYQESVSAQVAELLSEFYALHCKSIAFPELAIPAIVTTKRWIKKSRSVKANSQLASLVAKLEANAAWVQEKRNKVEFAPDRLDEVDAFLKDFDWEKTPLGIFVVWSRKIREERRKMLEESLRQKEGKNGGKEDEEEDESDVGGDMSVDEDVEMDDDDEDDE